MLKTHRGSCHCGAVRYEVDLRLEGRNARCDCTSCTKVSSMDAVAKAAAFRLFTPSERMAKYAITPVTTRYFCRTCGVHCFGRGNLPELGGEFVSINLDTVDDWDGARLEASYAYRSHEDWQFDSRDRAWPMMS